MKNNSKKYAAKGRTLAKIKLTVDEKPFFIEFKGGRMVEGKLEPGTFSTDDEVIQSLIEKRADFKSKEIYIVTKEEKPLDNENSDNSGDFTDVPDLSNIPSVRDYLVNNHGANEAELTSKAEVKKFADSVKVRFIDWK